jgi:hypothetical protein
MDKKDPLTRKTGASLFRKHEFFFFIKKLLLSQMSWAIVSAQQTLRFLGLNLTAEVVPAHPLGSRRVCKLRLVFKKRSIIIIIIRNKTVEVGTWNNW